MKHSPSLVRTASLWFALSIPALAQLDPITGVVAGSNISTEKGAADVTLGDVTLVNHGLVGVGRIDANATDAWGESLGSVSGLQIVDWKRTGPGTYAGSFYTLPDRGYNSSPNFSNYEGRIQKIDFTFRPEKTGGFNGKPVTQEQLTLSYNAGGSYKFTVTTADGVNTTTGLVPDSTTLLAGKIVPFVTLSDGTANFPATGGVAIHKLAIDPEALVLKPDGSGYFGDEYAAAIYHFNGAKQIDAVINPPAAAQPHKPVGNLVFSSEVSNVNGRRGNQGMEGVALSPDGTRLFGLMQSATIQDSGSGNQGRRQARLFVYDVSATAVPTSPTAEYVITLPILNDSLAGGAPNKTAAQSEILALDNSHLLVLSRDGNGKGTTSDAPPVFKSVLLVDLSAATDISKLNSGAYDLEGGDITPSGSTLAPGIAPAQWVEAVNLLNRTQLKKFGLNLSAGISADANSLSEKWEGMALVPTKEGNPNDFFLFVANDNDFISNATKMRSLDESTITTVDAVAQGGLPVKNDTMFLVYHVTINGLAR